VLFVFESASAQDLAGIVESAAPNDLSKDETFKVTESAQRFSQKLFRDQQAMLQQLKALKKQYLESQKK